MLKAGGLAYTFKPDSNPAETGFFGQLPHLDHGDVHLSQSNAILRYVGKLAGLSGDDDKAFALSEMLIEEATDLMNMMNKAFYDKEGKEKAFDEAFATSFPKQFGFLEKLIPEGSVYFLPGPKRSTGGYAMAAMLDMAKSLQPDCLDAFPKLKAFHEAMVSSPAFDGIKDYPMYFQRR